MSLLLSDQKLGSHSQPGSSSHKFMLKGRQTGAMHRGHSWVFRAETYDTMLAWYDDMRALTEKTGEERNAFVRQHARNFSAGSHRASSISGDSALDEDEADEVPFSTTQSLTKAGGSIEKPTPARPEPGGRFPSDLNINRHLSKPFSHSSGSSTAEQDLSTMAGGLQSTNDPVLQRYEPAPVDSAFPMATANAATVYRQPGTFESVTAYQQQTPSYPAAESSYAATTSGPETIIADPVPPAQGSALPPSQDPFLAGQPSPLARHSSNYADWMTPAAGAAGAIGAEEYWRNKAQAAEERQAVQEVDMSDTGKTPVIAEIQTPHGAVSAAEPAPHTPVTMSGSAMSVLSDSTAPTELEDSPPPSSAAGKKGGHTLYDTDADGSVNATPTGTFFPTVLRHNTDTSIRDLHVPGEFPRAPMA
jgi:hypothetical protein